VAGRISGELIRWKIPWFLHQKLSKEGKQVYYSTDKPTGNEINPNIAIFFPGNKVLCDYKRIRRLVALEKTSHTSGNTWILKTAVLYFHRYEKI